MLDDSSPPGLDQARSRSPGHSRPAAPPQDASGLGRRLLAEAPGALIASLRGASKALLVALVAIVVVVGGMLLLFRFVDPPGSMLMLTQRLMGGTIDRRWVPLDDISPTLIRAVIASEDSQFCRHRGIDFAELEAQMAKAEEAGDDTVRGASTITMQVAKNLFLSPTRSVARKAVEMGLALSIEVAWPKRRILEIYLNIAEWGPGVFGAEAGAQYHFHKPAARLTSAEAALMAAALPNPILRRPGRPGPGLQRLANRIETRARRIGGNVACVLNGAPPATAASRTRKHMS